MKQHAAVVLPVVSRASGGHGLPGCSSGCMAAAEAEAFDAAVSAELVACTLGQRVRPELRVPRLASGGYVTRIIRRG